MPRAIRVGIHLHPLVRVSPIRLLIAGLPVMLREIIKDAASLDHRMSVTEELGSLQGLEEAIARTRPHILVVGSTDGELPPVCARSMYLPPHPSTLAVSSDGRVTAAYRLRPQGVAMENISPEGLVDAIRELSLPPPEFRG